MLCHQWKWSSIPHHEFEPCHRIWNKKLERQSYWVSSDIVWFCQIGTSTHRWLFWCPSSQIWKDLLLAPKSQLKTCSQSMKIYNCRNRLLKHKKLYANLAIHNKNPKSLKKTVSDLSKADINALVLFLKYLFSGRLELSRHLDSLLRRNKTFHSLENLFLQKQLVLLHDKSELSRYITVIANLLECLFWAGDEPQA